MDEFLITRRRKPVQIRGETSRLGKMRRNGSAEGFVATGRWQVFGANEKDGLSRPFAMTDVSEVYRGWMSAACQPLGPLTTLN